MLIKFINIFKLVFIELMMTLTFKPINSCLKFFLSFCKILFGQFLLPFRVQIKLLWSSEIFLVLHEHINNELITIFFFSLREGISSTKIFVIMLILYSFNSNPFYRLFLIFRRQFTQRFLLSMCFVDMGREK